MKTITYSILLLFTVIFCANARSQCNQSPPYYDLTVTGLDTLHPNSQAYTWGLVCTGGHLIDSALCCTRWIFIDSAGVYEAGPGAYGMVYLKSGGTFDAHGNNSFFYVDYEAGATILNYTGTTNLCTSVGFPAGNCSQSSVSEITTEKTTNAYPNPCDRVLRFQHPVQNGETIIIFDMTGKKCIEKTVFGNEIDISQLETGFYTFKTINNHQVVTSGKFAIAR